MLQVSLRQECVRSSLPRRAQIGLLIVAREENDCCLREIRLDGMGGFDSLEEWPDLQEHAVWPVDSRDVDGLAQVVGQEAHDTRPLEDLVRESLARRIMIDN